MAYAIIRMTKIKSFGELRESGRHNNREHKKTANSDAEKAKFNTVEFGVKNTKEIVKLVKEKIKAVEESTGRKIRSDAVIAQEYLLNASPEFFETLSPTTEKKWIEKNIKFMKEMYKEENVIQIVAHRDESHLHLQALVIPIVKDENGIRLSANEITGGSSKRMRVLQSDYAKEMAEFGLQRGRENVEMEYKELQEYKKELENRLNEAKKEGEKVQLNLLNVLNANKALKKLAEEKSILQSELKQKTKETEAVNEALVYYQKLVTLAENGIVGPKEISEILGKNKYLGKNGFKEAIQKAENTPKNTIEKKKDTFQTLTEIQNEKMENNMRKFEEDFLEKVMAIPITEYLATVLPHSEGKQVGKEVYYKSPFREEKMASFSVDTNLNVWHDKGLGEGGNLIHLHMRLQDEDFVKAVNTLSRTFLNESFSPTPPTQYKPNFTYQAKKEFVVTKVNEIGYRPLTELLETRCLKLEAVSKVLKEVWYKLEGVKTNFFGIGMKCDNGTYATFSRNGKIKIGTMDTTTIKAEKETKDYVVFEGMTDYAARLTEIFPRKLSANAIILHGANNAKIAIAKLEEQEVGKIYVYGHNDDNGTGEGVVDKFIEAFGEKVEDLSHKYKKYNDYNDYLIAEINGKNKGLEIS
jgi:hypothetical protein